MTGPTVTGRTATILDVSWWRGTVSDAAVASAQAAALDTLRETPNAIEMALDYWRDGTPCDESGPTAISYITVVVGWAPVVTMEVL
jgi:hypothetical protein